MLHQNPHTSLPHVSDEDLIRAADGELSARRASEVDAHLEACWDCRARMEDIESTITKFVRAHRAEFDGQLPPALVPRSLLRARLAELGSEQPDEWWRRIFQFHSDLPRVAVFGLPLIAMITGILWFGQTREWEIGSTSTSFNIEIAPDHALTPGATREVTISEVCSVRQEQVIGNVPVSVRQKVFQEYGIADARPEDYEIDYLIAPRLGGTDDIHNLWPEPYRARLWNARVKDALEERLHEMVCDGQLDLQTAQHEIATDWIAAYKKYFHTTQPLPLSS